MNRQDAGDDLLNILDEIDELITNARAMPMSTSAIVNREQLLEMVDRAREAVPTAVHRAEGIVSEADEVLAQGRSEAERLVLRAQEEAEQLVAAENVVKLANERADQIVAEAEQKAAELRHGADDYCDRSLAKFEVEINRISEQVRAGRDALNERLNNARPQGQPEENPPVAKSQAAPRRRHGWSVDPSDAAAQF